jgi:hypothetical protein
MKKKQYFVHYSRKLKCGKKKRLHLSMFMWSDSLASLLTEDSPYDYVVYSATVVLKGKRPK